MKRNDILKYAALSLLSIPCLLMFNENTDAMYLNFVGMAYSVWFYRCVLTKAVKL